MPLPLLPATLLPGETTYPSELQVLVNRLASVLFTPDQPRDFYRHTSPDQAPAESLWLDQRSGALKAQNSSSVWRTILSGNFNYMVYPTHGTIPNGQLGGTSLFNKDLAPTALNGVELASLTAKPYMIGNRMFVLAHLPVLSASESDITVFGTLNCPTSAQQVFAASTVTVRGPGQSGEGAEMTSLLVLGVHTPAASDLNANGELTYRFRVGTDDADAQVYYNRKTPTPTDGAFQNFMKITMLSIEIPSV